MKQYLVFYEYYEFNKVGIYRANSEKEAIFEMYKDVEEYEILLDCREEDLSLEENFEKWLDIDSSSITVAEITSESEGVLKTISCGSEIKQGFFKRR